MFIVYRSRPTNSGSRPSSAERHDALHLSSGVRRSTVSLIIIIIAIIIINVTTIIIINALFQGFDVATHLHLRDSGCPGEFFTGELFVRSFIIIVKKITMNLIIKMIMMIITDHYICQLQLSDTWWKNINHPRPILLSSSNTKTVAEAKNQLS